jgi:hypothetical protein
MIDPSFFLWVKDGHPYVGLWKKGFLMKSGKACVQARGGGTDSRMQAYHCGQRGARDMDMDSVKQNRYGVCYKLWGIVIRRINTPQIFLYILLQRHAARKRTDPILMIRMRMILHNECPLAYFC